MFGVKMWPRPWPEMCGNDIAICEFYIHNNGNRYTSGGSGGGGGVHMVQKNPPFDWI